MDAMARMNFSEEDEGKKVVNATGEDIGMVKKVQGDRAHVDPSPGLTDAIRSKLGWTEAGDDDYVLESDRVEMIDEDTIRLSE